jgi:starvation-inducible DNA-binding protein
MKIMSASLGITDEHKAAVAAELSKLLADEVVLYFKTRNAHWNVEGPNFYANHKFFEGLYEQLDNMMDEVVERIRSIGHYAPATLKRYTQLTHLAETQIQGNSNAAYIQELLADHEAIIIFLRGHISKFANTYHDLGSSDFITGLMKQHEKIVWMLQAHLK